MVSLSWVVTTCSCARESGTAIAGLPEFWGRTAEARQNWSRDFLKEPVPRTNRRVLIGPKVKEKTLRQANGLGKAGLRKEFGKNTILLQKQEVDIRGINLELVFLWDRSFGMHYRFLLTGFCLPIKVAWENSAAVSRIQKHRQVHIFGGVRIATSGKLGAKATACLVGVHCGIPVAGSEFVSRSG